jgi:hypothetical protein
MTDEQTARHIIQIAKGGIEIGGIDERILIPNIVGVIRAERELCAEIADAYIDDQNKTVLASAVARAIRARS